MMRNIGYSTLLLIFYSLLFTDTCQGQLHLGSGTFWVSTPDTYVVLNDIGLQYDGGGSLLNNTFRFTGNANSAISGNTLPWVYAISLAKSTPGDLFLTQGVRVSKSIYFQSGLFDLNSLYINLDTGALLFNESETSRIFGTIAGGVTISALLNGPVAANPGNLGAYITSPTGLGNVSITRGHVPMSITDTSFSIARYFDIAADSSTLNVGLRFHYFDAELNGLNEDSLGLWVSPDVTFTSLGFTTRDATQNYVEKQGINKLGRFTLYPVMDTTESITPPPVSTSILLTGSWNNQLALLNWAVSYEYDNDHFNVERKYASDTGFTNIASVPTNAPAGTSTTTTNYTYTDSTVNTGPDDISYRIHQVGSSGQSAYSNIITLKATSGQVYIRRVYPTVVTSGRIYIQVGNMSLTDIHYRIYDGKADLIRSGTIPYQSQTLNVGLRTEGMFLLILQSGDNEFVTKFLQ